MIIGTFERNDERYHGIIKALGCAMRIDLVPVEKKTAKSPDYRVVGADGTEVEVGAGWRKRTQGKREFISLTLDSPMLSEPLNCAIFAAEDKPWYNLVWTR